MKKYGLLAFVEEEWKFVSVTAEYFMDKRNLRIDCISLWAFDDLDNAKSALKKVLKTSLRDKVSEIKISELNRYLSYTTEFQVLDYLKLKN